MGRRHLCCITVTACIILFACAPKHKVASSLEKAEARRHYECGLSLLQLEKPEKAHKEFVSALKLEPNNHLLYLGLGRALKQQGELIRASHALRAGIKLNTNTPELFYYLGDVYARLEVWPSAVKYSIFALEFENFKQRARALYNLGLGYKGLESWEQARYTFEAALLEDPQLTEARWQLALVLEHLDNWAESIRHSRKILRFSKNHPQEMKSAFLREVNTHIATAYSKLGKPRLGRTFLEKARRLALDNHFDQKK